MFRIGIYSVKAYTSAGSVGYPRTLSCVKSTTLLANSLKAYNVNKSISNVRAFSNMRNILKNSLPSKVKSVSKDAIVTTKFTKKAIQPFVQKRLATFNQLGRNTYGRTQPNYNNVQNNIIKPFVFVTLFTIGAYFLMPYIFDYTPMSFFKKNPQYLIWTIMGLNAIVFGLWQVRYSNAILYKTLENYFIMDRSALTRTSNWSLIFSTFSHQEGFHLLVNMGCLYSFSGTMISMLGLSGFTSLYLISGAWASFFSLAYSQIFRYFGRSLGASGSIAGVFTTFATMFPTAGIAFFFIPIPGGASVAAGLFAAYNVAGCLLKWGSFDYAAHLGGMWVGFLWGLFLKWKVEREEEERRARLRRFGF